MAQVLSTLIVVLFLSVATPADAAGISFETITFEDANGVVFNIGEFLDVGDYRFTFADGVNDGAVAISDQDNIVEKGTSKLYASNRAEVELKRVDNGPFNLHDFDLGGSFFSREDRWADHVEVISTAGIYTAALSEIDPVYTSHAPNIANVTSVRFTAIASKPLFKQDVFEELGTPCGFFSFALQTSFGSVSFEKANDELSQKAEVLCVVAVAKSAGVFMEYDVEDPVHAFD